MSFSLSQPCARICRAGTSRPSAKWRSWSWREAPDLIRGPLCAPTGRLFTQGGGLGGLALGLFSCRPSRGSGGHMNGERLTAFGGLWANHWLQARPGFIMPLALGLRPGLPEPKRWPPGTPKGLRLKARGCEAASNPGFRSGEGINPERVAALTSVCIDATSSGLQRRATIYPG